MTGAGAVPTPALRTAAGFILAVLLVAAPRAALAGDAEDGRAAGRSDALTDIKWTWVGVGFCVNAVTVGAGSYLGLTQPTSGEGSDACTGCIVGALVGGLFGMIAVGAAYGVVPSPRAARLLGKSDEYIRAYTEAYQATGRGQQVQNAALGWVFGGTAVVAVWTALVIVAAASFFGLE